MICLAVTYKIKAGEEENAAEHLRRLTASVREEPGNLMFCVHRVQDDPQTFFIYEQYADKAALDAHWASPHFAEHGINGVRKLAESRIGLVCEPLV
jgi:quinol monooxygenase YgiN